MVCDRESDRSEGDEEEEEYGFGGFEEYLIEEGANGGNEEEDRQSIDLLEPFQLVHHLVFEEDDGVLVADCGLQQAFRVIRRRRQHDFQSRHVAARTRASQRLRMLRCRSPGRAQRGASPWELSSARPTCNGPWRLGSPSDPSSASENRRT